MRQSTYLNVILTINAVLLAGLLWTQIASGPVLADEAVAQEVGGRIGIPNAAEQRKKMIDAMQDVKKSVDATKKVLESGKIKVEVTNLDEIRIESGS